ncbi:MAG: hypothetical protein H0W62_15035 [Chitinophagales bacterium]|nr:hypothetical protein [Chitinophagales bacterium]
MTNIIKILEDFFFDVFSLAFPGFLLLLLLILPDILFTGTSSQSIILPGQSNIFQFFLKSNYVTGVSGLILFIISYILGHAIKVTSKLLYDFMESTLDALILFINKKPYRYIVKTITQDQNIEAFRLKNGFNNYFYPLYHFLRRFIRNIFSFKPLHYEPNNEKLVTASLKSFDEVFNKNVGDLKFSDMTQNNDAHPDAEWYSVYKLANIIIDQENIKTRTYSFLAKYNLYRSLAFLFAFYIVFLLIIKKHIVSEQIELWKILLWASVILTYTFHDKFKRYFRLCGNEALMSFYYFMMKEKNGLVKQQTQSSGGSAA